ncbi:MAG: ergothioneine biosynthesis protein EgtB [Myxococcota bacterium]|nr:ergothioneine biosynthesis protein EgtB [Myxococcota bacterium]
MVQPVDRHLESASRDPESDLAKRYVQVRGDTLALADGLSELDANLQSMPDASPVKWHLAHTSWFFETFVLEPQEPDFEPFAPSFRVLFNSYYNSVGDQYPRSDRGLISRPGLDEVRRYREAIDQRVLTLFKSELGSSDDGSSDWRATVELGLHHEQQHQELILTDLKHAFSKNPDLPVYRNSKAAAESTACELRWHSFDEGLTYIGDRTSGFAFDNERPSHRVFLEAFELASRTVTNGEWREFMEDGGYSTPELWLSDGWAWLAEEGHSAPDYWSQRDGEWYQFTLGGLRTLRDDEPVAHVSYYEADAFATWAGARLPREAEWEIASRAIHISSGNFLEAGYLHPVALAPSGGSTDAPTPEGMFGNVWEWTASPYVAYPGYRPAAGALGEYNGKFMADQWVLRGGSCATPVGHVRSTYRNFFQAATRWQFAGLRLARDC